MTVPMIERRIFFFQAEDGIRDADVTGSSDVCSSDLETLPRAHDGGEQLLGSHGAVERSHGFHARVAVPAGLVALLTEVSQDGLPPAAGRLAEGQQRSEERRVGKEWRSRGQPCG